MIEIKHKNTGATIYTSECETLRQAVLSALSSCADLSGAYLRGANLRGADLSGAYLRGADLRCADLSDAYLRGLKINKAAVYTGLYKYVAMPIIAADGTEYIRLGCHTRAVTDWQTDFWNNPSEFPNDGDMPSKLRWLAYQTCLEWLKINRG